MTPLAYLIGIVVGIVMMLPVFVIPVWYQ